jgi:kinesin family protein 3/17
MQIYNEQVYDLLAKDSDAKLPLPIRESLIHGAPSRRGPGVACSFSGYAGVYVENLSEFVVRSRAEVQDLLDSGRDRLVFAQTKMNRESSRSHALCRITVERRDRVRGHGVGPTGC